MAEFIIKPLDDSYLTDILRVYQACEDFLALGPQPKASIEMVKQDLHEAIILGGVYSGIFLPIKHTDQATKNLLQLCGVLSYVPACFEGQPDLAFILLLMISVQYRRLGLGSLVLSWLEAHLRQKGGVIRIQTGVQVNNPGALHFWQRQGYQIISPAQLQSDTTIAFRLEKNI